MMFAKRLKIVASKLADDAAIYPSHRDERWDCTCLRVFGGEGLVEIGLFEII
ncbi:MAG: hypothetical protein HS131_07995 [Ignavibacteriales bacterium]|nr:hypothetical protein [Ignavibacteriales bacterium]